MIIQSVAEQDADAADQVRLARFDRQLIVPDTLTREQPSDN